MMTYMKTLLAVLVALFVLAAPSLAQFQPVTRHFDRNTGVTLTVTHSTALGTSGMLECSDMTTEMLKLLVTRDSGLVNVFWVSMMDVKNVRVPGAVRFGIPIPAPQIKKIRVELIRTVPVAEF
jgi:hypothetical protein